MYTVRYSLVKTAGSGAIYLSGFSLKSLTPANSQALSVHKHTKAHINAAKADYHPWALQL
jgi:hypothetical protein